MPRHTGYIQPMRAFMLLLIACRVDPTPATSSSCDTELTCVDAQGEPDCEDCDTTCQLDHTPASDASHIEGPIAYDSLPPAGGPHMPCWAEWGIHTEPVEAINFVHNQEHGGIIFLYNCPEGCDEELEVLTQLVQELNYLTILSPYPDMDHKFAVTAWEHRMLMNCLDIDALSEFYDTHVDQGPESVASMPPSDCMD